VTQITEAEGEEEGADLTLLPPDFPRLFIDPHPSKARMSQVPVWRPFGKLDLSHKERLDPLTVLHFVLCE